MRATRRARLAAPPRSRDGGFMLPVALLVLVLLSMMAATGLYSARNDLRAAAAARDAAVALAAADGGANLTLADWTGVVPELPPPGDSVILDWRPLPDGSSYRVAVHRAPVGPDQSGSQTVVMYVTGRVPPPRNARRTVALVVEAAPSLAGFCCEAGVKVLSRIRVQGADGNDPVPEIDGTDRPPPTWGGASCSVDPEDLPGVLSSDARDVEERRFGDIDGSPPVAEDPTITAQDFTDLGGTTFAGLASLADYTFPGNTTLRDEVAPAVANGVCDTTVVTNWGDPGDPSAPCGDHFPLVYVDGNLRLERGGSGQGILLVSGNMTVSDQFSFTGVVLVLGSVTLGDEARIRGGVMARGGPRGNLRTTVQGGAKVQYSSCAVERARAAVDGGAGGARERNWFEVMG